MTSSWAGLFIGVETVNVLKYTFQNLYSLRSRLQNSSFLDENYLTKFFSFNVQFS